ncbi:hypothetical protein B9Z19DRAFT_511158 [Tuber borchii]|uniref:Uncharacterized protein n=1 Tax=Tuber borchii TaxID=42251 RepID=A0A2T6ZE34_TUBBO|nr:hypothetical protein B9Z19DRAFT_511158 [Tuber borchii]
MLGQEVFSEGGYKAVWFSACSLIFLISSSSYSFGLWSENLLLLCYAFCSLLLCSLITTSLLLPIQVSCSSVIKD